MTRLVDISFEDITNDSVKTDATCFLIDGEEVWLDNAKAEIDEKTKTVTIPEWYARKKGLA